MSKTALDEKIARLKAELANAKASKNKEARKERNGQLIALGVYIEEFYKTADAEAKKRLEDSIKKVLTGRNLERALNALKRLGSVSILE